MLLVLSIAPSLFLVTSASSQTSSVTTVTTELYEENLTIDASINACYYTHLQLEKGWAGHELFGSISVGQSGNVKTLIDFWIMNSAQYADWSKNKPLYVSEHCKFRHSAMLYAGGIAQYSLSWVVPDSDTYYFVFLNPNSYSVYVGFSLSTRIVSTVTGAFTSYQPYTTPTSQGTTTTTYTETYATSTTPEAPTTGPLPTRSIMLGVIGTCIVALVTLLFFYFRQAKARRKALEKPRVAREARVSKKEPRDQFCIECGATLPPKSKFCNKCGSAQP